MKEFSNEMENNNNAIMVGRNRRGKKNASNKNIEMFERVSKHFLKFLGSTRSETYWLV